MLRTYRIVGYFRREFILYFVAFSVRKDIQPKFIYNKLKPTIKIFVSTAATWTSWCILSIDTLNQQLELLLNGRTRDYQIPIDLCRPLFQLKLSGRDANNTHSQSTQVQGDESKWLWGLYVKLTSVQQAKYTLANSSYCYSKSIISIGRFPRT